MELNAEAILQTLEAPRDNWIPLKFRLQREASIRELKKALQQSQSLDVCQVLIDILGYRHARSAVSLLLPYLDNDDSGIRSATADALAAIKSPEAGAPLLRQYKVETERGTRNMIAVALGAVGHAASIPVLIEALKSPDPGLRGSAAWSLGALGAVEALDDLQQALSIETTWYPKERLMEALAAVKKKLLP
jgi:HEAT repeat protein